MAVYYFHGDATGNSDGSSEANAYDGSTTATLPDGSSSSSTFKNVISTLQAGDTLYVKQGSSPVSISGSTVTSDTSAHTPTRFDNGGTPNGYIEIIGYHSTINDGLRVDFNLSSLVWREDRGFTRIKNFSFTGSYSNAGMVRLRNGVRVENCRFEHTNTGTWGAAIDCAGGHAIRCEFIGNYSTNSPDEDEGVVLFASANNRGISDCYVEARNGQHGIATKRSASNSGIDNCIINVNLNVDGNGYSNGNGIHHTDSTYSDRNDVMGNIIHGALNGIYFDAISETDNRASYFVSGNIFSNCTRGILVDDRINSPDGTETLAISEEIFFVDNFYHNCTSSTTNCASETNITVLAEDPFVDSANKDFTIANPSDFGYAAEFQQAGASGDTTITKNALIRIKNKTFSVTDSGTLSLSSSSPGDKVTVSGRTFQKVSSSPIVWRRS